ncbi:MAG: 50S ribosomal protein L27 [Candidatus Omnitrophota bacterium]|jgi:ribosomal protein L27|nr:MAG: 50S ribosomal protein L27 [Candidatus Omnitrophota bacterium]
MIGGFSTPKKDKKLKVSSGMPVKAGQILSRGVSTYKPGENVGGSDTIYALVPGTVFFSKKKTTSGKVRTFINVKKK